MTEATRTPARFTNPSRTHEARRTLLQTAARAAGYHLRFSLPDGTFPDVLTLHIRHGGLFIGEAKHTERPSDVRSVDRLAHYLGWLVELRPPGALSVLAVAHPPPWREAWRDRLDWLLDRELPTERGVCSSDVTSMTTVTFMLFGDSV